MNFEHYFVRQLEIHRSMQNADAIKLCYQATFGAEHLLSNLDRAKAYFETEFEAKESTSESLYEHISADFCRVNFGAWKREGRNPDTLFNVFVKSAQSINQTQNDFLLRIEIAERVMIEKIEGFNLIEWQKFLEEYKKAGMPPIHHSEIYRKTEKPSYRIVKYSELEKIL